MKSKSRSSANAATTPVPDASELRVTNTARAASPLLAMSRLLMPAPAAVARIAKPNDGAPTGLRKIHQTSAFEPSVARLASAARNNSHGDADRIARQAASQWTVRA